MKSKSWLCWPATPGAKPFSLQAADQTVERLHNTQGEKVPSRQVQHRHQVRPQREGGGRGGDPEGEGGGQETLRLRQTERGRAGGPGGGGDGSDSLGEEAVRERGHDWDSHPEPDILQDHHGSHGGHRLVPPQLRHGGGAQVGEEPRL